MPVSDEAFPFEAAPWHDHEPDGPPPDNVLPFEMAAGAPAQNPLPIQWFSDITMQLTNLWLVKRIIPATGIAVLYGHPGSGKTFLALDWALHVALGWEWHGHKVKQGVVVYVGAEGLSGLRNRVEAFRRHHRITDVPFALIPAPIDMQAPDADVGRLMEAIHTISEHYQAAPVMVVIDTLSKTFGAGKENTDDMVSYVSNCQRIANEFECLTMPVHHRPKDAESEDPRGHSSLKGGSETVILVESGEIKKARVTKQKDGEDGIEMMFTLKVIELGEDEDGDPVTSCVVEQTDLAPEPSGHMQEKKLARLPDGTKLVLRLLDEVTVQSGMVPPASIPDAEIDRYRVGKVVNLEDWRDKCLKTAGTDRDTNRDTLKRNFNRALTRLRNDGIVRVWEDFAWRTWESTSQAGQGRDNQRDRGGTSGTNGTPPKGGMSRVVPAVAPIPGGDEDDDFDPFDNPVLRR